MTDLERLAARLLWWKSEPEGLLDPVRLLAQVMVYGTAEDLATARRHFPSAAFRDVLLHPPAGLFDPRSWAYWHAVFGLEPPRDLPRRHLPE